MTTPAIDPVNVRRATLADADAIFALVPRLVAFGPPAWRDPATMTITGRKVIGAALRATRDDPLVLVAIEGSDIVTGLIRLHSVIDYYTEHRNGHIADLVVDKAYEGRGIGRQLLVQAEGWARAQQFEWLTISVFRENTRRARV